MGEPPESAGASLHQMFERVGKNELGLCIGQRVHVAGNRRRIGTVRYIGPVEGHTGEWIGVDWDDGDGKHDGRVNGVQYFRATNEQSASFVRLKNLSGGISLLEALYLRYRGESTKQEEDEMYVFSSSKRRVSIQLVGKSKIEEKLKHFEDLNSASMPYFGVGSINTSQEIRNVVPNLKELDLTGNLLSSWQDINSLCEALPSLENLNLTNNLLEADVPELPSFSNIRILVLNNCGVTWKQVERLGQYLHAVEELHLMGNKMTLLLPSELDITNIKGFNSLRLLNLENNCICSWEEVLKLAKLRRLEQLHLNKNKLTHIFYPTNRSLPGLQDTCYVPFEKLECLLLGSNQIDDLASVDSLNCFPNLVDVRLSENPIADTTKGGVSRFVLVARFAKVKILNGSEISIRERKESEIRYVRLVMAMMQATDPQEIKLQHPRFAELKSLYEIDDEKPSAGVSVPQKMSAGLISITLICVGASMGERQPLAKKLPPTTTVGRLKVLCESFFKLKGVKLRLFLQEKDSPLPTLLGDDTIPLMNVGAGNEATVLVDEGNYLV
ncbi:hypothetical protein KFK09_016430 [Dendrobium nobile]|uniref:CAP-Gly domain-containing protein n=1 Tax=Dendrobium nobile TaxID=94219 RepID=A0A8T3B4Q5_DENNO|nr:hypothetical protein KFK09_016430 [Dendrobium nobile]